MRSPVRRTGPGIRSERVAWAAKVVVVGAAYFGAAQLGLMLAVVEENVTPLWPASGIAVVAFLVLGRGIWPGIAAAAFLVNAPISASPVAAMATAAGNTLAPVVAALLLLRVGFRREIDRHRDAMALVFLAALGSMLISATVGAGTLVLADTIPTADFGAAWAVWWAGDAMGVLAVAPFLLTVPLFRAFLQDPWARRIEAAALLVALALVSLFVVQSELAIQFLALPLLCWAAWRFQQRGAAPAALIVLSLVAWSTANGVGPFAGESLFETMLTLQAFNATVALTSLFFAALMSERIRARESLERAAAELEQRVQRRTVELSAANEQLTREASEREEAERRLQHREHQLAEAQHIARVGSWEWLIPENKVMWSDEMYRIHGYGPQEFPVTLEKAIEAVPEEEAAVIRGSIEAAMRTNRNHQLPDLEYRIVRPDGERVLLGRGRLEVDASGEPLRLVGTVQDITEGKQAEREHRIAGTLQRSLLPERLPEIPGVALAARYQPASSDIEVGGDWYDVVQLANGHVALAIGDVAGHGLQAASIMGQLRMAVRAYSVEDHSPARVVGRAHMLMRRLAPSDMATLLFLVCDLESGDIRFSTAGHPPPLLIAPGGEISYLEGGLSPPLGVSSQARHVEATGRLARGSTLILFTDGLVERRGLPLTDGLARLEAEASRPAPDRSVPGDPEARPDLNHQHDAKVLNDLCDRLLGSLVGSASSDDVALLAFRLLPLGGRPLRVRMPAEPRVLAPLRHALRRWFREIDADPDVAFDVILACGEACANAIQHAYGAREGVVEFELDLVDGAVDVTVTDTGRWRPDSPSDGGRGLDLMRKLMDRVDVDTEAGGTSVRMRRQLRVRASA